MSPPLESAGPWRLAAWVAGCLLLGGLGGLGVRQAALQTWARPVEVEAEVLPPAAGAVTPESLPLQAEGAPVRVRAVDIAPPPDPFERTSAEPLAAAGGAGFSFLPVPGGAPGFASAAPPPPARPAVGSSSAARVRPAPESTRVPGEFPTDLSVSGVVRGDPPLAVVRRGGETFFLKIGEQVADNWRLEAIRERSVVFVRGEQRVELPLKGGSPE